MIEMMKNLVIAVSPDSSLELLQPFADILVLDKRLIDYGDKFYETVYIRSHFSQQSTSPENFRNEIDRIVQQVKAKNLNVKFIDNVDNVDTIVAFEDKWLQYVTFAKFMPRTEIYSNNISTSSFVRPVFKNRLSSRGSGVTWDKDKVSRLRSDWIVQESLEIQEELRVYIIRDEVYPVGVVKQSMTEGSKAQGLSSRSLRYDEISFLTNIIKQVPKLEFVGIDIARSTNGGLNLIEVNRSPGFARFFDLTGVNLAHQLYKDQV